MRKFQTRVLVLGMGWLALALPSLAHDDVSVFCSSPAVTMPAGGGTVTADVNCVINAPDADNNYRITASSNNFMAPSLVYLSHGLSFLTATLQPTVSSPDSTVTSISGTSSGFTARLSSSSTFKTLRFQYSITAGRAIPSGAYVSYLNPAYYRYRICDTPYCNDDVFTGTAPANLYVNVAETPVSVTCASPQVTATPGGGSFSLDVVCTLSGGDADKLSPSAQNVFSPGSITLSSGVSQLTATLQPAVTSPDSSVSGITGTASGGFSGNINALPAKIQVQYCGTTTSTTPAGTYTSAPVLFTWSTI